MTVTDVGVPPGVLDGPVPAGLSPSGGVGVVRIDPTIRSVTADAPLLAMLGPTLDHGRTDGWSLLRRVHRLDRPTLIATVCDLTGPRRTRFRMALGPAGAFRWLEGRFDVDPLDDTQVIGVVVDVDDLVRDNVTLGHAKAELEASDRFHRAILAATPDVIHTYDIATGTFRRVDESGAPLYDFCPEAIAVLAGEDIETHVPYPDRVRLAEAMSVGATLPDQRIEFVRHRVVTADGDVHWLRRRIGVLNRHDDGTPRSLFVASLQITDLMSVEQRLEHAATHDESTGLANRRKFMAELEDGLRQGRSIAIAVLEIEHLRSINDTRGREVGDAVLSAVARRLRSAVRAGDVVARLGDTEFGLLVSDQRWDSPASVRPLDTPAVPHIERVVDRVEELLAEPFHVGDIQLTLTVSVGIVLESPDGDAESKVKAAHAAMDRVRRSDNGGRYTFDSTLAAEIHAREVIERNLRRALRDNALEVYYQPIVNPHTGRVHSVEALMRLRDEDGQMLPVEEVIDVAERCGLVSQLDDQMLEKASRQVALWRQAPGHHDLRLAINRSAKDLNRSGFHHRIMRTLSASGLPGAALLIEVTETVLLHVASARLDEMRRLHDSGVGFAIDDFGTGYASLSQLISLPISEIKIDRSFTARMLEDPTCATLVVASVRIAADLGMSCVVEGVETVEQLEALPDYHGLLVQGYLYARPQPAGRSAAVPDVTSVPQRLLAV